MLINPAPCEGQPPLRSAGRDARARRREAGREQLQACRGRAQLRQPVGCAPHAPPERSAPGVPSIERLRPSDLTVRRADLQS